VRAAASYAAEPGEQARGAIERVGGIELELVEVVGAGEVAVAQINVGQDQPRDVGALHRDQARPGRRERVRLIASLGEPAHPLDKILSGWVHSNEQWGRDLGVLKADLSPGDTQMPTSAESCPFAG
jgi:hypothetical protein